MRLPTLSVALSSILTVAACAATPALAYRAKTASSSTGATPAGSTSSSTSSTTSVSVAGGASPVTPATATTPAKPAHHAPITAKTPNIAYSGPVYERTATGQLVPYTPSTAAGQAGLATASSVAGADVATPAAGSTTGAGSPTTTAGSPTTTGAGSPTTTAGSPSVSVTGGAPTANPTQTGATTKPELLVPGHTARIIDGLGAAPIDAPAAVQQIIWAGNQIVGLPYIYGGGHASFVSPGYDCSGTVSYALHGADLLSSPMDSTEFETWGGHGVGTWVTIFANGGHAYMTVAGIRLDTSSANDPSNLQGPRWRPLRPENAGFVVRHPLGL